MPMMNVQSRVEHGSSSLEHQLLRDDSKDEGERQATMTTPKITVAATGGWAILKYLVSQRESPSNDIIQLWAPPNVFSQSLPKKKVSND